MARENTLDSFRAAVTAGADAVELDVRLTRDRVPVVLHDRTLERLWEQEAAVSALTLERLGSVADGVPSLAEALAVTKEVRTWIDLPDPAAAERAVGAVREAGAEGRVAYTGKPDAMRRVRAADPAAELALAWHRTAPIRPTLLADLRPHWLNYRFGLLTPELVARARKDGLRVAAWTADSPRTMRRLAALGTEAITTNHLAVLLGVLGRT